MIFDFVEPLPCSINHACFFDCLQDMSVLFPILGKKSFLFHVLKKYYYLQITNCKTYRILENDNVEFGI